MPRAKQPKKKEPDLVELIIALALLTGIELLKHVRKNARGRSYRERKVEDAEIVQ